MQGHTIEVLASFGITCKEIHEITGKLYELDKMLSAFAPHRMAPKYLCTLIRSDGSRHRWCYALGCLFILSVRPFPPPAQVLLFPSQWPAPTTSSAAPALLEALGPHA